MTRYHVVIQTITGHSILSNVTDSELEELTDRMGMSGYTYVIPMKDGSKTYLNLAHVVYVNATEIKEEEE